MKPGDYKAIRESLGTQAEVAAFLGVARETIARRETGKDRITREAALALEAIQTRPKNRRLNTVGQTTAKPLSAPLCSPSLEQP